MKFLTLVFTLALIATQASATPASKLKHAIKLPQKDLQPFLEKHCIKCHGPKKQKGDVRFDRTNWVIDNNDSAQRWQDVLDQLNAGDMPPEEEDQPSPQELTSILKTLTGSVHEARQRLTDHGGEIKMRRLNKREYSNTIQHLFGITVDPNNIPSDGEIVTFDTVGQEQFFTSAHVDQYLDLARGITTKALKWNKMPRQELAKTRTQPEETINQRLIKDLADKDRKKALIDAGKTWKEAGFKDEGEMEILLKQWESRAELPRSYLKLPLVDSGVYLSDVTRSVTANKHIDQRAEYIAHIHGGVVGDPLELRKILRLRGNSKIHGTLKMQGTPEKPETNSMRLSMHGDTASRQLSVSVEENRPNFYPNLRQFLGRMKINTTQVDPNEAIFIDWIEIEGPFYPAKRPLLEEIFYPDTPSAKGPPKMYGDDHALAFISEFAFQAFRREKLDDQYLMKLHDHFKQLRKEGAKYDPAMAEIMAIILSSPSFLYIQEAVPAQDTPHGPLSSRELAVRLSYFLWSSPPDDELYAANLLDPKVYNQQVDRLLADPKSDAFRDGFISQWAEFDRYDAITIDQKEHYLFNEGLQQDAKRETREFFGTLIEKNLPVANLIDSNFVNVNAALASHYEIPGVDIADDEFQIVKLPKGSPRGGMLGQIAFLTMGSNGERSSPVIRGAMILEKILHDKPAPPPPNVPELDEASDTPMTNRQMVLAHQKRSSCASCHKNMDVLGFGLENFDSTGRWRLTEKVGKKQVPIETSGTFSNGKAFTTLRELKQFLGQYDHLLAKELVSSTLAYGLGRTIEFSDRDDVDNILSNLKKDNYRTRDLIREVARSPLFKRK